MKITPIAFQQRSTFSNVRGDGSGATEEIGKYVKILCLSTYPVDEPRHGGQHRLANIIAAFRCDGHDVRSAGVLGSVAYPAARHFVACPPYSALSKMIEDPSLMEDWAIAQLFATSDAYFSSLATRIDFKPDIIFVEQPWLFRFAIRYNQEYCNGRSTLCYGSQNVEHRLKYDIVKQYFGDERAKDAMQKIYSCELDAIVSASKTFCVSQNDVDWCAEYSNSLPILAPNGVVDRKASVDDVIAANRITQGRKFALFCASAHPPNITGFLAMLGQGPGCFPPDTKLVVAGGAGGYLAHNRLSGSLQHQYINAGEVPENILCGLLETAHLIILPITVGSGTNLKSAEAIWSGKHVVGTTVAMRGFEQFCDAPGLTMADNASAFCEGVRLAMVSPSLSLSAKERVSRKPVLWDRTLSAVTEWVKSMEPVS